MKRLFVMFAMALLAVLASDRCHAQFSKLSIGDYGIKSISPESFRSVNGAVWIDVTNPEQGFTLSDISGVVYKNNSPFVRGTASNVHISKGSERVVISGNASLASGVSLWTVLSVLSFDPEDYSVDIIMRVTLDSGQSRMVAKYKVPLTTLLKLR